MKNSLMRRFFLDRREVTKRAFSKSDPVIQRTRLSASCDNCVNCRSCENSCNR
jgi:hypothetical protein